MAIVRLSDAQCDAAADIRLHFSGEVCGPEFAFDPLSLWDRKPGVVPWNWFTFRRRSCNVLHRLRLIEGVEWPVAATFYPTAALWEAAARNETWIPWEEVEIFRTTRVRR